MPQDLAAEASRQVATTRLRLRKLGAAFVFPTLPDVPTHWCSQCHSELGPGTSILCDHLSSGLHQLLGIFGILQNKDPVPNLHAGLPDMCGLAREPALNFQILSIDSFCSCCTRASLGKCKMRGFFVSNRKQDDCLGKFPCTLWHTVSLKQRCLISSQQSVDNSIHEKLQRPHWSLVSFQWARSLYLKFGDRIQVLGALEPAR